MVFLLIGNKYIYIYIHNGSYLERENSKSFEI